MNPPTLQSAESNANTTNQVLSSRTSNSKRTHYRRREESNVSPVLNATNSDVHSIPFDYNLQNNIGINLSPRVNQNVGLSSPRSSKQHFTSYKRRADTNNGMDYLYTSEEYDTDDDDVNEIKINTLDASHTSLHSTDINHNLGTNQQS